MTATPAYPTLRNTLKLAFVLGVCLLLIAVAGGEVRDEPGAGVLRTEERVERG